MDKAKRTKVLKKEIGHKKLKYPTKTSINMMTCGLPKDTGKILTVGLAAIVLMVVIVAKIGVIDQFARLDSAEHSYNNVHEQNRQLDEKLKDYNKVALEYKACSMNFLSTSDNDEEAVALVDRQKVLDLIEAKMMKKGEILTISISNDTAVVNMSGMNLKQISDMNASLKKSPIVREVSMKIAQTEENKQASILNFTVTIYLQAEEA